MISIAAQPVISGEGINFSFGQAELRKQILFDIQFQIQPGEVVLLMGPSGSGKTTLLTLIAGLRTLQEGQLNVLGHSLAGASREELLMLRRKIGFIFQAHNLLPYLTALQNVQMMFDLHPEVTPAEGRELAMQILHQVGLGDRMQYHISKLSGGRGGACSGLQSRDCPCGRTNGGSGRYVRPRSGESAAGTGSGTSASDPDGNPRRPRCRYCRPNHPHAGWSLNH